MNHIANVTGKAARNTLPTGSKKDCSGTPQNARDKWCRMNYEYVPVVDSLEVTPNSLRGCSVGLKTKAKIGSKSMPEGAFKRQFHDS
jgi:hypothetical protein